ncbi:hypothetical protein B1A_16209 [mine drainage metagenome]|uniref:CCHC-type domain-containing protein n=1 Tax=mine drainage metagenome TaxID=410659 RepID=T1AK49_9ZZZZ
MSYLLQCQLNKYYVGRCYTNRLTTRIQEHKNNKGAAWTTKYPVQKILLSFPSNDPLDEEMMVLKQMRKYGINNVRGGSFSNINLTFSQKSVLQTQLYGINGKCFNCGSEKHWYSKCPLL